MRISFRSYRLEALCSNPRALRRKYGLEGARKIEARLSDLEAAVLLEDMRLLPGRCHELTGDRSGYLAVDLHKGFRLVFSPFDAGLTKSGGGIDWRSVSEIVVHEIVDYH